MKQLNIHFIIQFIAHANKLDETLQSPMEWCKENIQSYGSYLYQFRHVVSS